MKTNSILLNKMHPDNDFIGTPEIFPVEMVFNKLEKYYSSIIGFMELRAKSMFEIQRDVFNQIEEDAKEEAEKQEGSIFDKHEFKSAYSLFHIEIFIDQTIDFEKYYPQYFRRFFLTQIYSFVETELKFICETINEQKNHLSSMKEISKRYRNSYLENYLDYLVEFEDVNLADLDQELNFFRDLRVLRNLIIHNLSIISSENDSFSEIQSWANSNQSIELEKLKYNNEFEIHIKDDSFIKETIKTAIVFFKKLLEEKEIFKHNEI